MSSKKNQNLIIYASHLLPIGGVETFVVNFCKRLSQHYNITFVYDTCSPGPLEKLSKIVPCVMLGSNRMRTDVLILATAWGRNTTGRISADTQIQMIHADYVAFEKVWGFKYIKQPGTTHHVAVGKHVASQFEAATPYKVDKVIYNLL